MPYYFWIIDKVKKNDLPHQYKWYLHSRDFNTINTSDNPIKISKPGTEPYLDIYIVFPNTYTKTITSSPMTPKELSSLEYSPLYTLSIQPHKTLTITQTSVIEGNYNILLIPINNSSNQPLYTKYSMSSGEGVCVKRDSIEDYLFNSNNRTIVSDSINSTGDRVFIRKNIGTNQVLSYMFDSVATVSWNGKLLANFYSSIGNVSFDGIDAQIYGSNINQLKLYAPSAEHLYINNIETIFNRFGEYIYFGDITENETWSGGVQLFTNQKVMNGGLLTINPGSVIKFSSNIRLDIYGTLLAQGNESDKVLFTSIQDNPSVGDWNGIYFYNSADDNSVLTYCDINYPKYGVNISNSNILVDNCEIMHCNQWGIYIYQAKPTIQYCQIENNRNGIGGFYLNNIGIGEGKILYNNINHNTYKGIYLLSSSPEIRENEINNNNWGIYCTSNSSPKLGKYGYFGHNYIHANSTNEIYASSSSNPLLGVAGCEYPLTAGENIFDAATNYYIYAVSSCNIQAENNWWGTVSPNPSKFYKGSGCSIDYTPWMMYPPQGEGEKSSSPEEIAFESDFYSEYEDTPVDEDVLSYFDNDWPVKTKLLFARDIINLGYIDESQKICKDIIENYPDSSLSFFALDILWESSRHEQVNAINGLDSFREYLSFLSNKNSKNTIYAWVELILSDFESENALPRIQKIEDLYYGTEMGAAAIYKKLIYFLIKQGNTDQATAIFNDLKQKYPSSHFVQESYELLMDFSDMKVEFKFGKPISEINTVPSEFALIGNFPNPFNPSTVIKYVLPDISTIEISIFNILGQKVREFYFNEQEAGMHSVTWDGTNEYGSHLPTGIYIYRINLKSINDPQSHFSAVAKILLIK